MGTSCTVLSLVSSTPPDGTCANARVYRGARAVMTYENPNSPTDDKKQFTTNWIQVTITKMPQRVGRDSVLRQILCDLNLGSFVFCSFCVELDRY